MGGGAGAAQQSSFSCRRAWALGVRLQEPWLSGLPARGPQQLCHTGLAAPGHVDSPGPGIKPVFPALAGGRLSTVPPGKA